MSVATIATLAVGIGLDTGVFTLVDGILLRARVERDPQSFVEIRQDDTGPAARAGRRSAPPRPIRSTRSAAVDVAAGGRAPSP